jgi:hypothetical protein
MHSSKLFFCLGVVDFSEEVLLFIGVTELLKPQAQDGPMDNEKNTQKTKVINTEPFSSSIGGHSGGGNQSGRDESGNTCHDFVLYLRGLHGHGKRSNGLLDSYIIIDRV